MPIARTIQPKYGVNYAPGYIGFTQRTGDFVSAGISWFERWEELDEITVSHTFVVSGEDEVIEAHAKVGVQRSGLNKYFNDPHCRVFFRKPVGYTLAGGNNIIANAARHIGDKYGYGVIAADALANSLLGHYVNACTWNVPNRFVSWLLDRAGSEVCSELVAMALKSVWLANTGCLTEPARMITPQDLFVDKAIFEPWNKLYIP